MQIQRFSTIAFNNDVPLGLFVHIPFTLRLSGRSFGIEGSPSSILTGLWTMRNSYGKET